MADVIAYVDGFNLYNGLHDAYGRRYLWLDLNRLATRMRPKDSIVTVRYFTAMVRDDPAAQARQKAYLGALKAHNGDRIKIVYGRFKEKRQTCRNCGSVWTSYEEKQTDVAIASFLVADSAQAKAELALVISADGDLCPGIRAARTLATVQKRRIGIIAAFPPRRHCPDIRQIVPGAFTISHADIRNSLLPDTVTEPQSGRKYLRPAKWY